ncbi:FGGY family carbohydrate kinase [Mesorhizobium sp.]|uniref:FGGY family carbohydrate kinase n=1 Tax=Mesorhizobium sp. TaxID=1871066 RepID=UPI000FE6003C|nr:FGGY family carbohydrate kinase [Mesorhizobium sp.]RWI22068.1 MAG: carbohydrate kinase [Mesorhizobium sp.]RWK45982.1 MAG: carbohydrate kinase [Mesorhizobium sp.]RWK92354.1 MAG: carbohydrate kinase [Mesorhizobium sp.]TIQ31830.1 MAG: carbohydrate kinase [Mesorhizobium sp.]
MSAFLLCLDSGTTAVKAAAFDRHGRIVASAQRQNRALRRDGARIEQDMAATRDDAFAVLRECAAGLGGTLDGILVTGQGDGLWPLDAQLRPAGHAMTWLDGRARQIASELQDSGALDEIQAVTGSRPTAASQSLQLLWLQRNDPQRLATIAHLLRLKEWLFFTLTHALLGEPTAALPVWGDWRSGALSPIVQRTLGLPRGLELLPDFAPVGECRARLSPQAASATGIATGTPVLLGPGDVQSTLVGLGLGVRPAVTRASIFGTSAIHACHILDPALTPAAPAGAMLQRFVLGDGYFLFQPSFNGATLFQHIGRIAAGLPAHAEPAYSGLILHPFLEPGGERAPYTSPNASGALFGLTAHARPEQIAWAGREGLAFVARASHEMMNAPAGVLSLGGGLAADPHFAGFLATLLDTQVERAGGAQAGLRGLAAIGARHLLGTGDAELAGSWVVAPDAVAAPRTGKVAQYAREKYALFVDLLDSISPHWQRMAAIRDLADMMETTRQ